MAMVSFFTNLMLREVQRCLYMRHPQPEVKHSLPLNITKPDYYLSAGPKESTRNSSFGVSLCQYSWTSNATTATTTVKSGTVVITSPVARNIRGKLV